MKPASLCLFDLPNGQTCRLPALKEEQLCRHHMHKVRHGAYEITFDQVVERYSHKLLQMNLPDLLITLRGKLARIRKTLPRWHEARITLEFAIDALTKTFADPAESTEPSLYNLNPAELQNRLMDILGNSSEINDLAATSNRKVL